jgi:hypothetical protein
MRRSPLELALDAGLIVLIATGVVMLGLNLWDRYEKIDDQLHKVVFPTENPG